MRIPLWTCWDVAAAALVILYTLCWVKTFWMLCYICSVTQGWTKACRGLLIPGLCVDSTLLCCCGQYCFSTQWDVGRLAWTSHWPKGKVTSAQWLALSNTSNLLRRLQRFFLLQRSDCSHCVRTFIIPLRVKVIRFGPPICFSFFTKWLVDFVTWGCSENKKIFDLHHHIYRINIW